MTSAPQSFRASSVHFQILLAALLIIATARTSASQSVMLNGQTTGLVSLAPGAAFTVSIANPSAQPGDWLGLAPPSAPLTSYQDWWWMNGTKTAPPGVITANSFTIPAPTTPGSYQLRYVSQGPQLIVAGPTIVVEALPTVTVNGASSGSITVLAGATLTVAMSNPNAQQGDWFALAAPAAPVEIYSDWLWMNGTKTMPPTAITSNTVTFTAPTTLGTYVIRYVTLNYHLKATSATIVVALPPPTLTVNGVSAPAGSQSTPGATLTAVVANASTYSDWVGLFAHGAPRNTWIDWKYLNGTQVLPATSTTGGTSVFSVPASLGNYEVRLYDGNGNLIQTSPVQAAGTGLSGISLTFGTQDQPSVTNVNGTGADGALFVNLPFNCQTTARPGRANPDCIATRLTTPIVAGAQSIPVARTAGFSIGDEVLIAQAGGLSEFATVSGVFSSHVTVATPVSRSYEASTATSVAWTNISGVTGNGNSLTNTACTAEWQCGASSTQTIASGDGFVEFTATEIDKDRMVGLSVSDTSRDFYDPFSMM